ncbi:MAG: hypothetical protein K6C06_09775 [Lachnospiraceae bacterium]|nr:hypothetical protein [Lachnospiraceae bacterium]
MRKEFRRGLAAALCVCLSFAALTGCSKKTEESAAEETAAAVTLGENTITSGAANFMLRYEQAQFESGIGMLYTYYGYSDYWNTDLMGTGQPYSEVFKEQVGNEMQNLLQAEAHMADYGVELTDADKKAITEAASSFIAENEEEVLEKMSATQENVERILTLRTIQSKMEQAMTADVDTVVSDEEAAQRTVSYAYFTATTEAETEAVTEDEEAVTENVAEAVTESAVEAETEVKTGASEEAATEDADESALEDGGQEAATEAETEAESEDPAMIEARAKAQAAAEDLLAKAADAQDGESFDAMAKDAVSAFGTGYASEWTFGADDTYPDAAIIEATEGLEDNTLVNKVITIGDSCYVVFVSDAFDEEATEKEKVTIVQQRKADRVQELYTQWQEENAAAIDADVFSGMLFDFSLAAETEPYTESAEDIAEETTEAITEAMSEAFSESVAE